MVDWTIDSFGVFIHSGILVERFFTLSIAWLDFELGGKAPGVPVCTNEDLIQHNEGIISIVQRGTPGGVPATFTKYCLERREIMSITA